MEWILGGAILLGPLVILAISGFGYYWLGRPRGSRRSGKNNSKDRAKAILQVFENQYRQGRITKEQFEDILQKYSDKTE